MIDIDLATLVEWLGAEGAVAGLEHSNRTNSELIALAQKFKVIVEQRIPRRQLVIDLVMSPITRIDKSPDDMLKLTEAEIRQYFNDRMVSNAEIKALLEQLDIAPAGRSRGRLAEFAAREISELGVYQRVARGGQHSHR